MPQTVASGGSNECLQQPQQQNNPGPQQPGVIVRTVATVTTTVAYVFLLAS